MYYVANYARTKKRQVSVTLVTADGKSYEGVLFIAGDQRVKDLLNGEDLFIPFETNSGDMYLLNSNEIARVTPHDDLRERPTSFY